MKQAFLSHIVEAQSADVVTSFGGSAETRISPRVAIAVATIVYEGAVTIMVHPPTNDEK